MLVLASSVAGRVLGKKRRRVSISPAATITMDGSRYWMENVPFTLRLKISVQASPEPLARMEN